MAPQGSIPSPCISVCSIDDATGFCRGCFRTTQEVAEWPYADDGWKAEVLKCLEERKAEDRRK
ncbi:MAG: DUF1289 domain-containing protein [Alphaproteobacteria bacterium]|nr:DUF1289 domain-containing protein [Alphaproteobacteria bacterium]